jgi:hypothetical protein
MMNARNLLFSMTLLSAGALMAGGCHDDRPHDYGTHRPDVGSLDSGDSGLQSKDLVEATDQATADLLRLPELNDSREQWTIVSTGMENDTTSAHQQYDIFINRLKTNMARQGHGRVTLIENRDRFHYLQSKELEPIGDPKTTPPGPAGVQPQFALNGRVEELPNRRTSTYRFEFDLTDLRSRRVVWSHEYLVKVER